MRKRMVVACVWTASTLAVACGSDDASGPVTDGGAAGGSGGSAGASGQCPTSASVADCAAICPAVVAAACPGGPTTQAECEEGCTMLNDYVGSCPAWGGVVDCMGSSPTFSCMDDQWVPVGCEDEFYCVSQCFD